MVISLQIQFDLTLNEYLLFVFGGFYILTVSIFGNRFLLKIYQAKKLLSLMNSELIDQTVAKNKLKEISKQIRENKKKSFLYLTFLFLVHFLISLSTQKAELTSFFPEVGLASFFFLVMWIVYWLKGASVIDRNKRFYHEYFHW